MLLLLLLLIVMFYRTLLYFQGSSFGCPAARPCQFGSVHVPDIVKFCKSEEMELSLLSLKCRFAKVGNTAVQTSRHLHRGEAAGQSEMPSDALGSSNSSWRLSLLRSVMGDSICETGSYFVVL